MDVPHGIHCPLLAAISTIIPLASSQTPSCSLTLQGKVMGQHKAYGPGTQGPVPVCGDKD